MTHTEELLKTPLHALHLELGARMVPFAGYDMPVQYPLGVMKEHLHTRSHAGLFDVSHMGQILLRPKSGDVRDAALALETITPVDVAGLGEGRQRYGLFTNETGGLKDDFMVANRGDHLYLVVNAACKHQDLALIEVAVSDACDVEARFDRGLLALQGPMAEDALSAIAPEAADMRFMDVRLIDIKGMETVVSRSGYTGEDGYEISVAAEDADRLARLLLDDERVEAIGLGARDSLRLEAGLCLYGNDIGPDTTPAEAALTWAIQKARRGDGEREGGFPGDRVILGQLARGADRKRVGLSPEGKAPVRGGARLFAGAEGGEPVGAVTSGGFGPSLEAPVAMGYVPAALSEPGTRLYADVRGKRLPVVVATLPFVPNTYKR
ncbi:aminomethyltransferase [Hoeflea marina]|uniref:aminomethyltransferase n=1 Tax=Hoeflea marina TaxID=274592 RepID=A0A317PM85_9HYPH|nr:glycine cleavage system aminomethyltransferase GcvT [Hoeflea marina]PWW01389.1 aminomethyltransferase [Hoeflea marina]